MAPVSFFLFAQLRLRLSLSLSLCLLASRLASCLVPFFPLLFRSFPPSRVRNDGRITLAKRLLGPRAHGDNQITANTRATLCNRAHALHDVRATRHEYAIARALYFDSAVEAFGFEFLFGSGSCRGS